MENLHMISFATLVLRLGPPQLPTLIASPTLEQNPTTVATQMGGSQGHGIRKSANHKLLSKQRILGATPPIQIRGGSFVQI